MDATNFKPETWLDNAAIFGNKLHVVNVIADGPTPYGTKRPSGTGSFERSWNIRADRTPQKVFRTRTRM